MDKFEMYVEIRGMLNQKYSISSIAKKLNISRNTVYKYKRKSPEEMAEWTASTMTRSKKLDIHKELILHWLREFPDLTAALVILFKTISTIVIFLTLKSWLRLFFNTKSIYPILRMK